MKKYVSIVANTGEDNYTRSFVELIDETHINVLNKLSKLLVRFEPWDYNWRTNEWIDKDSNKDPRILYKDKIIDDEFKIIEKYIPYDSYGIHTIISIEIINVGSIDTIF